MEMIASFELETSLKELQSRPQMLEDYLDYSLGRMNELENKIHAFVPESRRRKRLDRIAQNLQENYSVEETLPPLYGIPVGIKDIFHVDGLPTRAGSRLDSEILTGEEGFIVEKLRESGAVALGKTVTTEFAYFVPGPTRNPHNTAHTPGGSSSGSAAAVAAGYCPLAVGTQTIGSVIRPAAFCGVVGFKPSYDRVPREGLVDFSPSADHIGFFTQDVEGMKSAASCLVPDWERKSSEKTGERPVLGVPADNYLQQAGDTALDNFNDTMEKLQQAGYSVKKKEVLTDIGGINEAHQHLIAREFAEMHEELYEKHGDDYRSETVELIEEGRQVTDLQYQKAREKQSKLRSFLHEVMDGEDIDIWISPSAPGPAPEGIDSTGDPVMNLPWTNAGLPAVSVPSGFDDGGLPLGLQLAAAFGSDEELLEWTESIADVINAVKQEGSR